MIDSPMRTIIPVAGAGASATANLLYWTERAQARRGGSWITLVNRPLDRHAVLTGVNGGQRDFSRDDPTSPFDCFYAVVLGSARSH